MEEINAVRRKIIDEVKKQFLTKGANFSVDIIAGNTKTSKKTIYRLFENKESLLADMCESVFEIINERVEQVFDIVRELLCIIGEGYIEFNIKDMMSSDSGNRKFHEKVNLLLDSFWNRVSEVMEKGVEKRKIRKTDITNIRFIMESTMIRLADEKTNKYSKMKNIGEFVDELVCILTDGLRVDRE